MQLVNGKKVFENIRNKIVQEESSSCNDEYIEIIFKVAFLDFWRIEDFKIDKILKDIMRCKNLC